MRGINIRTWPSAIHRLIGFGPLVNVAAIHTKRNRLPSEIIHKWYFDSMAWMEALGFPPKTLSFAGVEGFVDANIYEFEEADIKLRIRGFVDIPVIAINAAPMPKLYISGLTEQWERHVSASLKNSLNETGSSHIILTWENDIRPFSRNIFFDVIKKSCVFDILDYAIFSQDYSYRLPTIEAGRLAFQGKTSKKRGVFSSKGYPTKKAHEKGLHPMDFLRDIYPFQILSPVHLSWKMGNGTLKDWIESSSLNGELSLFSKDRWLWEISESKMDSVRNSLAKHNLLTLYLPDMNRILEDYANPS